MSAKQITDEILGQVKGTTFARLDYRTSIKLLGGKKNPYQGRVEKIVRDASVMLFSSHAGYINMVNRRLKAEGKAEHVLQPRKWGQRVEGTPYIHHMLADGTERYYLDMIFKSAPTDVAYTLDGQIITDQALLDDILKDYPEREEADQSGLEDKVIIRSIALANILGIRVNGKSFVF